MNVEMPSPETTEHLRMLLLIVLGIMIVTIPVVALLVVAKVKAQQRQRPVNKSDVESSAPANEEQPSADESQD